METWFLQESNFSRKAFDNANETTKFSTCLYFTGTTVLDIGLQLHGTENAFDIELCSGQKLW